MHEHPHLRVRIGLDMGEVKVESLDGRPVDVFGRHVDWSARAMSLAADGHICVTRPVYNDAFSWLTKKRIAWKEHGSYLVKRGEPSLEIFEPYNANITRPLRRLRGEKIVSTRASRTQSAATEARRAGVPAAATASPVAVVRPWENVARDGRDFAANGAGAMYWFRVPLGGVAYPEGFRNFLPALENGRITKIRFVLDRSLPPIRRVWNDLVLPLVTDWGESRGRSQPRAEQDDRGRITIDEERGRTLAWIFVDLSREFTPCFKLLVQDLDSDEVMDTEAQIFLATAARSVWLADGTQELIKVPDAVLRIRRGEHEALLHALNAVANQWDSLFI